MARSNPTAPAIPEVSEQPRHRRRFATVRDLALAGIGIAGVLSDEAQTLYTRSVARGGSTVQKVQNRFKRASKPRRWQRKPACKHKWRSGAASSEIEAAFARLNIPTVTDINALNQQVAELEAKIGQLNKQ